MNSCQFLRWISFINPCLEPVENLLFDLNKRQKNSSYRTKYFLMVKGVVAKPWVGRKIWVRRNDDVTNRISRRITLHGFYSMDQDCNRYQFTPMEEHSNKHFAVNCHGFLFSVVVVNSRSLVFTIFLNAMVLMAVITKSRLQTNPNILLACLSLINWLASWIGHTTSACYQSTIYVVEQPIPRILPRYTGF